MRTFADSKNRTWQIELTIGAAKRVRDLVGVDLLNLTEGDPPLLTRLAVDVILLCDCLYALVQPQATALGVSDEDFGAALGGAAIKAAHDAFWEELAGFFRQLSRGDAAQAIDKQMALTSAAIQIAEEKLSGIDVSDLLSGSKPGISSTSLRLSPDSIHTD